MPRAQHIAGVLLFLGLCLFWILSNLTALPRDLPPPITDLSKFGSSPTHSGSAPLQKGLLETTIPGHAVAHGFTVLDNVYLRGGTFFIVTKNANAFPERRFIISRPVELGLGIDEPTDKVVPAILHTHFVTPSF